MVSLGNFDANQVEPQADLSPIPAGEYRAAIIDSQMKSTKSGNGQYLELTMEIVDGQYKGRRLWDRLNLANPNATAVQIARSTLSSICRAVGVLTPKDSSELHNRPMVVRVALRKREDNGEDTNEVKGYKAAGNASPASPSPPPAQPAHEPAPWE